MHCPIPFDAGTLSVQEFLAIPELEHNPLVNRVVHTFDIDKSGEVDFREFVSSLSVFATHESQGKEQKYKCTTTEAQRTCEYRRGSNCGGLQRAGPRDLGSAVVQVCADVQSRCDVCRCFSVTFRVYDVDNDGFISNADLYHVLKAMVRGLLRMLLPNRSRWDASPAVGGDAQCLGPAHCRLARCSHDGRRRDAGCWSPDTPLAFTPSDSVCGDWASI